MPSSSFNFLSFSDAESSGSGSGVSSDSSPFSSDKKLSIRRRRSVDDTGFEGAIFDLSGASLTDSGSLASILPLLSTEETALHEGHLNDPGCATLTREPHCVQLRINGKFTGVSVTTGDAGLKVELILADVSNFLENNELLELEYL